MGYLVALVITVPMGYFNLDDNMIVQVVAFCLTLLCWLVWLVACFFSDTFQHGDYSLPAVASGNPWNSQVCRGFHKVIETGAQRHGSGVPLCKNDPVPGVASTTAIPPNIASAVHKSALPCHLISRHTHILHSPCYLARCCIRPGCCDWNHSLQFWLCNYRAELGQREESFGTASGNWLEP